MPIDFDLMEVILDSAIIIIYLATFFLILKLSKKLYGGRFTTVIPPLVAGVALLLSQSILTLTTEIFFEEIRNLESFKFGVQVLQLVSGILFVAAFYKFYEIIYATVGFFEEKQEKTRMR